MLEVDSRDKRVFGVRKIDSPAIFCNREIVIGSLEPSIMAKRDGSLYLLSHIGLSEAEFDRVVEMFNF